MAEEYISIPELTETVVTDDPDFLIVRQGVVDRKINLSNLRDGLLTNATTSVAGIVQLNDEINSTSLSTAATANAAKKAYDRGSEALSAANSALSQLTGKANTSHFHNAATINTGVMSPSRLPWAQLNLVGIVRPSNNLNLSSSGSYVPSIEVVRDIKQQADGLQDQINNLELGTVFTPMPSTATNSGLIDYPIGTTLLVSAGVGYVPRNQPREIRLTVSGTRDASSPGRNAGAYGEGRYHFSGFPGSQGAALLGTWVSRGSYSPVWPSGAYSVRVNRAGSSDEYPAMQNCVLMQRVS